MFYHPFKKTVKSKSGKVTKRWYYWWIDPITNIQHQKIMPGITNQVDAYSYVSKLEQPTEQKKHITIKEITKDMFLPNSEHIERLNMLGKKLSPRTMMTYRRITNLITERYGHINLEDLTIPMVNGYLMSLTNKSGSWKNTYLETLTYIYKEAPWHCNYTIVKPDFPRFARNSKKADIFSSEELVKFFDGSNWVDGLREYLLFLVTASCGLRLGEARGLRVKQILPEQHALIIDGFCENTGKRTNYNKKGSDEDQKLRVTLIPDQTLKMLLDYIISHGYCDNDFIFQREDGSPLRQEFLESVFHRVIIKAGIDSTNRKLCPHSFRFTYVTRMRTKVNAEVVQKMVGHSSIEMTEYYTRAAIPEMVSSIQNVLPAVNELFE